MMGFSALRDTLHSTTGWHSRLPAKEERAWVLEAYESGEIKRALAHFHRLLATCKWTPASSRLPIAECLAAGTQSTQHGFLIASAECFFSEQRRPNGLL